MVPTRVKEINDQIINFHIFSFSKINIAECPCGPLAVFGGGFPFQNVCPLTSQKEGVLPSCVYLYILP